MNRRTLLGMLAAVPFGRALVKPDEAPVFTFYYPPDTSKLFTEERIRSTVTDCFVITAIDYESRSVTIGRHQ